MSFPNYKYDVGLSNVGSYQVSGKPFVSGAINAATGATVSFPSVTRWIYIANYGTADCKVGFSENGVTGDNFLRIAASGSQPSNNSIRLEVKATELYLNGSNSVDVMAGLTGIPVARINNISPSGTNWSGSAGIG